MKAVKLRTRTSIVVLTITSTLAATLIFTACSSPTASKEDAKPMAMGAMAKSTAVASNATTAGVQGCAVCAGKGKAPMVMGTAADENGVQVVKIGVKGGYYSPNMFTVKAGQPVKVVFSGDATDCLVMPTFPSLKKKTDFSSGTGTVDLGALKAGTYEFGCGMKIIMGKIVAQ